MQSCKAKTQRGGKSPSQKKIIVTVLFTLPQKKAIMDTIPDSSEPHRDHLVLLALLRQIPDAVDEELVGADIRLPRLNHPTA